MIIVGIKESIPNFGRFLSTDTLSIPVLPWMTEQPLNKILSKSSCTKLGWSNEYGLKAFTHYFVSPKAISDLFALNLSIWMKEVIRHILFVIMAQSWPLSHPFVHGYSEWTKFTWDSISFMKVYFQCLSQLSCFMCFSRQIPNIP